MKNNKSLFGETIELGIGYHNVGIGVFRYADEETIRKIDHHYGQRCGHIPWNADNIGVFVEKPDENIKFQMEYLSQLAGRKINVYTPQDIINYSRQRQIKPLIVPYVNVPETVNLIEEQLNANSWGLPGKMTDILKNKSGFYKLVDELSLPDFVCPEYITADVNNLINPSLAFLKEIAQKYQEASLPNYPLGLMLRASDEDGNYGSALTYENNKTIFVIPDGSNEQAKQFAHWQEALEFSQKVLLSAMNIEKESRVVLRFAEAPYHGFGFEKRKSF